MLEGDQGWSFAQFAVGLGTHTFKWEYAKDASGSAGSDQVWLDDISFPPETTLPTPDPPKKSSGCAAGGSSSGAAVLLLVTVAVLAGRRFLRSV